MHARLHTFIYPQEHTQLKLKITQSAHSLDDLLVFKVLHILKLQRWDPSSLDHEGLLLKSLSPPPPNQNTILDPADLVNYTLLTPPLQALFPVRERACLEFSRL